MSGWTDDLALRRGPFASSSSAWDLVEFQGVVGYVTDAFLDTGFVPSC